MNTSVGSTAPKSGLRITSVHRYGRQLEFIYAVIALFLLTQGPVYRLWSTSGSLLGSLPYPSIGHAHFATFVAVQTPALAMWFRRADPGLLKRISNQALLALIVWLGLSVTWSTFGRQSLPEFVALVWTTAFGLYLATNFTLRQFWFIVGSSMALGLILSWLAITRLWDGAVNLQEDYWAGIYFNRNSLAPVATVALIAVVGVVLNMGSDKFKVRNLTSVVAFVSLSILSATLLWKSKSDTSRLALVLSGGCSLLVFLTHRLHKRFGNYKNRFDKVVTPLMTATIGVFGFLCLRLMSSPGLFFDSSGTFNSRASLWSVNWTGIVEKPWVGWGWMAARLTPQFSYKGTWWAAWDTVWTHNGYHDILLGGGVVAGLLFTLWILCSVRQITFGHGNVEFPVLMLIYYVLFASTQESFFIGSHFLWALLVCCLSIQLDKHDHSQDNAT